MKEEKLANNKLAQMFNLAEVKRRIDECPKNEIVILMPHYSINKPKYTEKESVNGAEFWDFDELGEYLDAFLIVSDFDDLIADPHGITNY